MPRVICIVTGPIVGVRSTWFLEETVEFARALGKRIQVFNVFDEILEQAEIQASNAYEKAVLVGQLLDGYQYQYQTVTLFARERFEHLLNASSDTRSAAHMLDRYEPSARTQDSLHLGDRRRIIRDRAQREGANHGVETRIGKLQLVGVTRP